MTDPTSVIAKFCRENKIKVFGSIRMNDCHDAFGLPFPKLVYPLMVETHGRAKAIPHPA